MNLFSLLFRYKDKKSPDKLGHYPERLHTPSFPERRYLYTSRFLVIFAVFSICINMALTCIVYVLIPQKSTNPSFFTINEKESYLDSVSPIQMSTSYLDLLTEGYIYEYIKMRHLIPRSSADLFYRWSNTSKFYWYSNSFVYNEFINKLNRQQLINFIKQKMVRTVEIDYVKKISNNLWEAKFTTSTTTRYMDTPDVRIWKAYLRVKYFEFQNYEDLEKNEREKINYMLNPFGFNVMSYEVGYIGKPEAPSNTMQTAKRVFENTYSDSDGI